MATAILNRGCWGLTETDTWEDEDVAPPSMLTWWQKIALNLFRPRPPRPAGGETSPAEIARIIVELIRLADQANGTLGKDQLVSFMQHVSLGRTVVIAEFGQWKLHFDPEAAPLAPDFRFRFEEDHTGAISFIVEGDYRYEGFHLQGQLTQSGTKPIREDWPIPSLIVSAEPSMMLPVTRHAKRLRDVFVSTYGAFDCTRTSN